MKIKPRKYVEVFYDPALRNWDAAIEAELKRRKLRHSQATVICRPLKRLKSDPVIETPWMNRAAGGR